MDALMLSKLGPAVVDLKIVESDKLYKEERSVVNVDYGEEEGLEFDHENDEKALLAHQHTVMNVGE